MKYLSNIVLTLFLMLMAESGFASDWKGKIGITPTAGAMIPSNGSFDNHGDLKDVVETGQNWGVSVRYGITTNLAVEGSFSYSWMYVVDSEKPEADLDPAYVMPSIIFGIVYKFDPFINLKFSRNISPFVSLGLGLHPWKFSNDGVSGTVVAAKYQSEDEFSKTSFGMNVGAGAEYSISKNLSVSGQGKYYFVFSEDEEKFGANFDNQGFIGLDFSLTYYLPLRK
ncbi:MAG: outer membrane beta-barrel protein [Calditrichaceae bacterium]